MFQPSTPVTSPPSGLTGVRRAAGDDDLGPQGAAGDGQHLARRRYRFFAALARARAMERTVSRAATRTI